MASCFTEIYVCYVQYIAKQNLGLERITADYLMIVVGFFCSAYKCFQNDQRRMPHYLDIKKKCEDY